MSGPSQDKRAVRQIVIHYNGGNADLDGPDNIFQDEDYARVLARMNDQYWNDPNRGYALGYNWGCGPDGDLWEIRGLDIRCGANGCQLVNVPATAIQVTTTAVTAPPTDAQIKALKNQWVPWLRTQYPNALVIVGHRDVRSKCSDGGATACPGPQLYPLVQQGYFNQPDSGNPTPSRRRKVFRDLVDEGGNRLLSDGQTVRWMRTPDAVSYGQSVAVASGNPGVLKVTKEDVLAGVYGEYIGPGYPKGPALATVASVSAQTDTLEASAQQIIQTLDEIKAGGGGGGGTVDVQAIAEAVADEQARRLVE
jgi:hypothetical protein